MGLLFGRFDHQIDEKNRIRIPKKFKDAFPKGEQLYFCLYQEHRVAIMPESVLDEKYKNWEDTYGGGDASDAASAAFGEITDLEEDSQGRTQIPKFIRQRVDLTKNVTTIGKRNYIEIWDTEYYDTFIANKPMQERRSALQNKETS